MFVYYFGFNYLLKKLQLVIAFKLLILYFLVNRTEVTWTVALIEEFLQQLMAATLSEDVKELKYALIPKVVWLEMESKMHIDHELLANFWFRQLHIQLFAPSPIYLNDVKIKLIEM